MITPKLHNEIKIYMLGIHESAELAESETASYVNKFNSLNKWDQMTIDYITTMDGVEKMIEKIDEFAA